MGKLLWYGASVMRRSGQVLSASIEAGGVEAITLHQKEMLFAKHGRWHAPNKLTSASYRKLKTMRGTTRGLPFRSSSSTEVPASQSHRGSAPGPVGGESPGKDVPLILTWRMRWAKRNTAGPTQTTGVQPMRKGEMRLQVGSESPKNLWLTGGTSRNGKVHILPRPGIQYTIARFVRRIGRVIVKAAKDRAGTQFEGHSNG